MTQDEKTGKPYYGSVSRRVAVSIILVSLGPLFLITGIILERFNVFSHEMVHAHLEEMVLKHKHNIDFFLQEKLSDIRHLSRSYDPEAFKDELFLEERLHALRQEYSAVFVDLGLISADGHQIAYAGPFHLERAYYGDAEWFVEARETNHYISDVFMGLRDQPHFIVSSIITAKDGKSWILRATIDFHAFNILVENLHVGETGSAFILNRKGEFQTRPPGRIKLSKEQYLGFFDKAHGTDAETGDIDEWAIFPDVMERSSDRERIDRVISTEKTGTFERKIIIVASFLKGDDWLLIFQQEADDAYAMMKRTQRIAAILLVFGTVGIIFVALVLSRNVQNRIARVDSEKEMMNKQIVETGKLATIGELAAGIAHEINNPVAIMVEEAGWIQDLLDEGIEKGDNLQEFRRALAQIGTQGIRCKEITHKLLSFARKTDSKVQSLDINDMIEETVSLSSQKSRYASVEANLHLDPDLPAIQASATEMQQVLMNLVNNAIEAMEKKGGTIDIRTEAEDNWITITIEDNGPGIPKSNLNRIFDPFFTTKSVGKGTGLGLSICYGIIQKMGGRIDVESAVNVGTKFSIVLPANNRSEQE